MWFLAKKILRVRCRRPIGDYFTKREDRKTAEDAIKGKIFALAKVNSLPTPGSNSPIMKSGSSEPRTKNADNSWKDEYGDRARLHADHRVGAGLNAPSVSVAFPEVGGRMGVAAAEITDIMTGETIDFAWLMGRRRLRFSRDQISRRK